MEAWKLLFGSDIGLLSVITIVGVIIIGGVMVAYYSKQAEQDARNANK